MSDIRRNADRNRAIQAMMTDGEQLKTFYRFVANNPHIPLHDACQIVIERPNASVCFSFEEWNAQGRRVTKGRKGIPYYDSDGNKYFVFDVADTHGENRYRRITQPVKKILDGLDLLNGTEIAESNRGDYRIMLSGVVNYLGQNDFLTENDEIRNRLIAEGVAYSLYSTTGFPKERGITLKGYPYGLQENADLFREVQKAVEVLQQDINDAIYNKQNEVPVIDDIDEEYVSDEPIIPKADEKPAIEEEKSSVSSFYAKYSELQKANPDSIVVYRLGDFYEVMGEKAEQAATILDLTLTGRNVGLDERIPMCGFPYHVADRYFGKLTESVSVVVVEPDAEPFKILSRAEARKTPELKELSPEESEELDRIFSEREEAGEEQPDYVGEIDTRFPIDDDYGDEDEPTDEEIEEAFEAAKEEKSDEETEDYDYAEDKKQTKETKPENRGKPIWERRNRPSMQRSLFDEFEEKTPEEKLKEWGLKRGSGFEYGKYRIYEKYQENPTDKEFADFLRREYGTGGGGYDDEIWTDGKGMKLRHRDRENPENEVGMILKWEQVAYGIADLIDEDKYFDDKESEEYIAFLSERRGTDENRVKAIARHIAEDGVKRNVDGERTTFLSWRYADYKFCKDHAAEIEKTLNACPEVATAKIDGDKVEITVKEAYRRYSEQPPEKLIRDLDAEEDEEWEKRIESGEITPIEPTDESTKESNTDLTKIGFEQSELGGAKQRFRNNLEAIKLVNRLVNTQKEATDDEKKVLAKYVGWGGLAQAFDEHNAAWQTEYKELKDVLNDEEYAAAKGSVLNAHYTSKTVIDGIYKALERFGVKGNNRILEPAMGTGNFFGFMPQEIADGAKLYGVELDRVTGKIATKLYPQAKIQIKGFEETAFADNSFDLMVTNVPFGGYTVFDSDYNKYNFYIHDYFIAKGIDKIKPNGLMAVITSKGTMDKQNPSIRKYIADRAELVGAIRLPNTAFKQTANTEVVTDILFFRKREEKINAGVENTEWLATGKTEEGYEINNYYISHPEMILGTLAKETGLYGAEDITVKPDGRDLSEAINAAISRLPQGFYVNPEYTEETESKEEIEVDYDVKPMNLKAVNGKLYMRVGDSMVEQPVPSFPKDAYQRIIEMIAIRKQLRKVLDLQVEGCSDDVLTREQWQLGARYDMFVKRFGYINSKNNLRLFKPDGDSALLFACENVSDDEETVTKADVFTKRTIRPYTAVTSTDDCFEALQISKNERGCVDISYIEELTKKDYDTVLAELGNAVFRNPVAVNPEDKYSGFETAEEYLSGRVVDKLQAAERMKQSHPDLIDYDKNISALREVQPSPVKASDIAVRVGTSWIDKELYKEFFCELIGMPYYYRDGVELYYNKHDGSWRIDRTQYARNYGGMNVTSVYGTSRANAYRLFEDCLNQRSTQIYDTVLDADGREKRVLNNSETVAAREKQNKIVEAFKDWIFRDPIRRDELETIYNRLFNQIRLPKYDGSYLRFPEMNPAIELRPHQKDAVHRIITSGNTLLHHIVGSGKTFTICAAAMKLRQYGLAKKSMIAVPNHLVQQWANSFRELYPTAKLLIATKDDLDKDHREQFVSKVAMGDWDSVIIAQSSFAKINISPERQIAKIQEEIAAIERSIEMQWEDSNSPSGSVKNLERIKKGREAQLKKLLDESKKDNVLIFEKLGVDYLFVDEADAYKNLFLYTKMNNVAGISNAASARASDLQLKIEYINELHGGDKGVVFATGTPISNSMTEMYTMQTYLQKRTLEKLGINYFDAWAADFGETVTALELAPSGKGYRARTRFAKFTNLPELLTLYHSFADVKTDVKLDVPEAERKVITLKPSDTVIDLTEEIAKRADAIYAGGVDPHIDNMLKVTGDGKKLALDPRCIDPLLSDESGSKFNFCADNVYEEWKNSEDIKGTQLVFCDLSTPKKPYSEYEYGKDFDAYNDLKHKLVERGIPETEIAFIHDANTDKAKQDLFDKVTAGTIRVLIGSTEKCGAGTNVQKRLVALHHLDAPYRPRDLIQRNGRGIRQGNMNKNIRIYTYATERTFDSYSYQILENKQRFISQVEKGDMTVREADDIDEATLSYAEIKAITSANPKIKRKTELDMEMARLRDLESRYKKELFALQDKVRKEFPEQIQRQELYLERVRKDVELVKEKYNPERFEINVTGTVYSDSVEDGKKNGGLALMDALFHSKTGTVVAEYCGFKISLNPIELLSNERSITLSGAGQYKMDIGESASGNLTRLENFVKEFAAREERAVKRLESTKADFEVAKEQVKVPFEHKDKIMELNTELSELNAELDLNKREEVVIDDEESGDEPVTAETEDNYMALPPKRTETKTRTNKKKTMLTEKLYKTYKQVENQNPNAMVFAVKNGDYTCFDDTTEELMALSSLSPSYFKVGEKEVKTLTIDETLFKEFASAFVSADLKIALFDEPEEEKTFIDESDRVAAMQVDIFPDYTISQEQMHEYGYSWDGMLPVRIRTARVLYGAGVELYRLGKNDIEGKVENGDFEDTESLYGVEKPAWEAFITSEKGKAYLTAWHNVVESASEVVREDMSYLDGMYADSLSDNFYEERTAIERALNGEYAPSEEAKPYLKPLLERYHKRFPLDILLEYYGWDNDDVYKALAENIPDAELREYAIKVENEPVSVESPKYKELVVNSIEKEFEEFKANLMGKSAEEIFQSNYEIHIKTELFDTLCGEYEDFGEEYYRALYEEVDHGGILQQLYDDFTSAENASVSTGEDTIFFIKDYCEHYHSDVMKEFKEQLDKEGNKGQMSENTLGYTKTTARGDKVVNIEKDKDGRDIAIIDRSATMNKDYVVAIGYHTETGDWEQGRYGFESQEKAENWRKNEYGSEKPKAIFTKINVANDAFIKKSGVGSVFKMPTNGEYAGFTYYMFNDKIRPSRQLVDLRSDSRELCYELSVRDDREIELCKGYGDNEQIVVLTAEEFAKAVGGTTNKDYETQENADTKWLNTSVPQEAFRKEYKKSMLFVLPNKQDFGGMSFFIPSAFVGEDKNSDDGRILIRLPEDFVIKAQSRDETREATLTAYDFNRLCNNTTAEDYKQAQAESTPGSETPSDWNYVSVPEKARIASFDESALFRMPDGKYQGYTYYVPNKCVKDNAEKGTIRLSLHNDFTVRLSDNSGEEKKTAELTAKDFCEEVRGKDAGAYGTEYKRPSVEANTSFEEREKALRTAVPDEMKARPNWVVVKTWWNADKGKYNKRPVNCNSDKGEYAESDNPETWTTFDNALKYLKEQGGTTIAYALDGKDNVSCIDLDHCYDENGKPTALAKEILSKCGKTYIEKSVSGNGLHIFGKTEGMDIRSFSKDGDLEFYQKEHFIAMTGDGAGFYRLESFDTPEMKELLSRKCEKREEWKGVCKGVNGLSTMTDRDVVEKASNAKNGDKFKRLYAGEDLQNNHSNSDMSLMNLLAYWCNGDKEQMLRIFATSGLFRPNKSPDYYEGTAIKALRSMPVKSTYTPTIPKNTGGNGKR